MTDVLEFLKSLPAVLLKYEPNGSLPDGDSPFLAETAIASDALASKALIEKPISGRGHPGAIRWRAHERDKARRQKPERKLAEARRQRAFQARKKIERPDEYKAERKARRPAERNRYARKLRKRNLSGYFVAIDCEGCGTGETFYDSDVLNEQGEIIRKGDRYREHRTFLWGAGNDDNMVWLGDQLLKDLPFEVLWEIQHKEPFRERSCPPDRQRPPSLNHVAIWHATRPDGSRVAFAINYLKGKWLKIGRCANPDIIFKTTKRGGVHYDPSMESRGEPVTICYVWGYFQSSFQGALNGMRKNIVITDDELAQIEWGKPLRGDFSNQLIGKIRAYTEAELKLTCRMISAVHEGLKTAWSSDYKMARAGASCEIFSQRHGHCAFERASRSLSGNPLREPADAPEMGAPCFRRRAHRIDQARNAQRGSIRL